MPLEPTKVQFLEKLEGCFKIKDAFDQIQAQKQKLLREVLSLSDEEKELLRSHMTFKVEERTSKKKIRSMDKEGQIKSIETEEAMQTKGWSQTTHHKAQAAMDQIVAKLNRLREARMQVPGPDGTLESVPMFPLNENGENDDIRREFFDPLVREGLMPETFVPDQFSTTKRLLDHAFEEYQEALEEQKKDEKRKLAKEEINISGGGKEALDKIKAKSARFERRVDDFMASAMRAKGETRQERDREAQFRFKSLTAGFRSVSAFSAVNSALKPEVMQGVTGILTGAASQTETAMMQFWSQISGEDMEHMSPHIEATEWHTISTERSGPTTVDDLGRDFEQLGQDFTALSEGDPNAVLAIGQDLGQTGGDILKTLPGQIVTKGPNILINNAFLPIVKIINNIKDLKDLKEEVLKRYNEAAFATLIQQAAVVILSEHADALATVATRVNPEASALLAQAYQAVADPKKIAKRALVEPDPDCQGVIDVLAETFAMAFAEAAPDADRMFNRIGVAVQAAFKASAAGEVDKLKTFLLASKVPTGKTEKWEPPSTTEVFRGLVDPARKALHKVLGVSLDDQTPPDPDADPEAEDFRRKLSRDDTTSLMQTKLLLKQEQEAMDDLTETEHELDDYERQLTQVDESGGTVNQGTIIKLIEKLQRERLILESAAAIGKLAMGSAGSVGIAMDAGATIAREVIPGLKLAGLTAQFAVNIVKAARRWALWHKFQGAYKQAKKANSALAPAIDRFFTNKKEQCAQHTIEDALLLAQMIGEALALDYATGIGIVVGKAISAVGKAGRAINDAAFAKYDITQLKNAWSVTKMAIQNPTNRRLGLEALSLNTSLAMHAIVWAAMDDRDPIGRQMMQACGLNEKVLDEEGTDAEAVKLYLRTLLKEDRWVEDEEKDLRPEWQPATVELNRRSWLIARQRAETRAEPPLRPGSGAAVERAFQVVETHDLDTESSAEIFRYTRETEMLIGDLKAYTPLSTTGQKHVEMRNMADRYVSLAQERLKTLREQAEAQRSNVSG